MVETVNPYDLNAIAEVNRSTKAKTLTAAEVDCVNDEAQRMVEEIRMLWQALGVLHAANAEDAWPCPTAEAWNSEALARIRRAIEEEAT